MQNETEGSGFRVTLVGAAVLAMALALAGGCGGDDEDPPVTPQPDGGSNPIPDGGVTPDGGTPPPPSADTEFALVRFNTDGTRDPSFGTNGVARVDVNTGTATARETLWGLQRDGSDRLVIFGNAKGESPRADLDRVIVRLTANGALDDSFATKGVHALNIGNLADESRVGIVQADGKIVSSGYVSTPTGVGTQSANRIILLRLEQTGAVDNTFGVKGVVNSAPFQPANPATTEWGMAEAYAVGRQSTGKYVTTGYGRTAPSGTVDLVSFRYTASGELDTTWGTNGSFLLNLVGDNDRGRNMVVLPDDRVFMVGSGVPTAQNIDAMTVMLTPEGKLDTSFYQDGYKLHTFGRADEAFFGAAVSPAGDRIAAAGYIAGGTDDDDALLYLKPIGSGTGNEFVQPVPISESSNDRFWAVTFDSAGKVYAAGVLTENGDSRMIVARFNADGSKDTSFGTNGVAIHNVIAAGTVETARGIVIQSDGKVVIAGIAEKQ
ncbi:MAG TPA: hypothetical protein VF815_08130 [Myxococcaceae bacterium]|jgi:uncharacterized delta-60 repeat protein